MGLDESEMSTVAPYIMDPVDGRIEVTPSYTALHKGMMSLLEKNKYSDLTVVCGSDRYPVHRAIVCARSTLFEAACDEVAHPSLPQTIHLDANEDPQLVAAMLTYLYSLNYSDTGQQLAFGLPQSSHDEHTLPEPEPEPEPLYGNDDVKHYDDGEGNDDNNKSDNGATTSNDPNELGIITPEPSTSDTPDPPSDNLHPPDSINQLAFHARMCHAGARYGIPSLAHLARSKFKQRLSSAACTWELVDGVRAVYLIPETPNGHYDGGDLGLRRIIVRNTSRRMWALKAKQVDFDYLIQEFPDFAAELLKYTLSLEERSTAPPV